MRLLVLSRSRGILSTRRLVEAGKARGHGVRVIAPTDLLVALDGQRGRLLRAGRRLRLPDVVVPRIAPSIAGYGLQVLEQLVSLGVPSLNSARAIGQSRNPVRCLQLLAADGLAIPSTVMGRDVAELKARVRHLGGVPVLVKLLQGSERRGVMVCESVQSLEAALEAVLGLGHSIVLQEYVREATRDVRVFVVGGRALAAVSRTTRPGRLTRSLARQAQLERHDPSPLVREAAERAAVLCGLEVCAVDLLEFAGGAKIFEVNASPELPDMEAATGIDLATPIIERAEALAATRGT